jgi:ATP phosphoribosyltransferase
MSSNRLCGATAQGAGQERIDTPREHGTLARHFDMEKVLTIGIPKGSLQEATLALFSSAGLSFYGSERSLWLASNDAEVKPVLLRPQEIPHYVANGSLDCGLSGLDWITETQCLDSLRILADLHYSKRSFRPVRWVLAVPQDSPWQKTQDLQEIPNPPLRVSTELKRITESWLAERGIVAEVDFSWGATEAKAPVFADAIVECTETGSSLQANRLRILDTVFQSTTQFFASKAVYQKAGWKRTKVDSIALLLKSCLAADAKVSVRVHALLSEAEVLEALIPSAVGYSVWSGRKDELLFDLIVDKAAARELVPVFARNRAARITVAGLDMLCE